MCSADSIATHILNTQVLNTFYKQSFQRRTARIIADSILNLQHQGLISCNYSESGKFCIITIVSSLSSTSFGLITWHEASYVYYVDSLCSALKLLVSETPVLIVKFWMIVTIIQGCQPPSLQIIIENWLREGYRWCHH